MKSTLIGITPRAMALGLYLFPQAPGAASGSLAYAGTRPRAGGRRPPRVMSHAPWRIWGLRPPARRSCAV